MTIRARRRSGRKCLTGRLAISPGYVRGPTRWLDPDCVAAVLRAFGLRWFRHAATIRAPLAIRNRSIRFSASGTGHRDINN